MEPGYYKEISNEDYHNGPGVSKSILDLVNQAPALVEWSRTAPRDEYATAAVDVGDAFHALLLEPWRYDAEYAIAPESDRRTTHGKNTWHEFHAQNRGKKVLDSETGRKLQLMRASVMCHPYARGLIEAKGNIEPSIYAIDPETGLLVRCRPDKDIEGKGVLLDVKTTGNMDNFRSSVEDFRYHVADSFYSDVYEWHHGRPPRAFLFLAVSTSLSMGRYPVKVFSLKPHEKEQGRLEYRENLNTYFQCKKSGIWPGIESLERPPWAKRR